MNDDRLRLNGFSRSSGPLPTGLCTHAQCVCAKGVGEGICIIDSKTVEVIVTDVLRQKRATAEQLRKLLSSINAIRGSIPATPNSNDDLAGLE